MTAARILDTLRRQRQTGQHGNGRTVIIVSHRLATVMEADQILVMRHGRITERGQHAELAALVHGDGHSGWYATQWRVQQIEGSLDDLAAEQAPSP